MDYLWAIHSIGKYTQTDAHGLEFSIWDIEEKSDLAKDNNFFFHFDLYNLPGLDFLIANGEYIEKDDKRYDVFINQRNALKNGKSEYFIDGLFYDEEEKYGEEGYNYVILNDRLNGKTIFEIKNKRGIAPYYAYLFISESEPLLPETVIKWLEKLSVELFGEPIQFSFAFRDDDKDLALKAYQEGVDRGYL